MCDHRSVSCRGPPASHAVGRPGGGLAKRGLVVGLIDKETGLNLVLYEAAAEHYYDASLASAETVIASLRRV